MGADGNPRRGRLVAFTNQRLFFIGVSQRPRSNRNLFGDAGSPVCLREFVREIRVDADRCPMYATPDDYGESDEDVSARAVFDAVGCGRGCRGVGRRAAGWRTRIGGTLADTGGPTPTGGGRGGAPAGGGAPGGGGGAAPPPETARAHHTGCAAGA